MSAAIVILPLVWAIAPEGKGSGAKGATCGERVHEERKAIVPELAFYRKYTEGMLRRYLRLSMEKGRVPSLLGREMFRGHVTSYRVHGFDDVVIFVHDVERCLTKLTEMQRMLIERIALQEYTQGEAARLTGMSLRTLVRRYAEAVDKLGSIPHAKALAAWGGLDRAESPIENTRARRRRPGLTEMLMQELKRGREAEGERSDAL